MTELRRDFLSGEWVAISPERAKRPSDFSGGICPFCPQNEYMTPPETYRSKHVRVFPNKYPALSPDSVEGYGIHEILVDTAAHDARLHELSAEHIAEVFFAIQNRLTALRSNPGIAHVQAFKNQGRSAGASLNHSHWQILAMPVLSLRQQHMRQGFLEYFAKYGCCYLCDSLSQTQLVIAKNTGAAVYVPCASPYSDSVNIMPLRHVSDFTMLNVEEMLAIAELLKAALLALMNLYPDTGYNICIQDVGGFESHVFMQLIPRIGSLAGFELSTGCFINSITPEETVQRFKTLM